MPRSHGLLPLYEAVVNSIHAIDEIEASNGEIIVGIIREHSLLVEETSRRRACVSHLVAHPRRSARSPRQLRPVPVPERPRAGEIELVDLHHQLCRGLRRRQIALAADEIGGDVARMHEEHGDTARFQVDG